MCIRDSILQRRRAPLRSPVIPQLWGKNPMHRGSLALLVRGGADNWSPQRWKRRFDEVCPDRRVLQLPGAEFDPAEIHYAAVWKPRQGALAGFPNLRVIFNLGAGVDAVMA